MDKEQESKRVAGGAREVLAQAADGGILSPVEERCPWSSGGAHGDSLKGFSQGGFCKAVKCRYADRG